MAPAALLVLALGITAGIGSATSGSYSSSTPDVGNRVTARADFVAPVAARSAIGSGNGGPAIKQGGNYFVYAQVSDSGNPPSGVSTVTADVSAISTGATSVALGAGSFSFGGQSYNHRSALQTAKTPLGAGTYGYSLSMTDAAGNSRTTGGFSVTVDNTAPVAVDIQTANGGTGPLSAGQAEQNDTITYTFSKAMAPGSILSGWSGSATGVVVRLIDNAGSGGDYVTVYDAANSTQLPLGEVRLNRTDYILTGTATFGASGTASQMTMSGNTITIVFGTQSGLTLTNVLNSAGTMSWHPSATATDLAGNAMSTATATESGAADREF